MLEHLFNDPATTVIENHDGGHGDLEFGGKWDKLQLFVDLRDELGGTGESDTSDHDDTIVHTLVLLDGLAEGTTLVVDGKRGDLLDKLQKVDGRVKERRFEFTLKIDVRFLGLSALHVTGNVDQGDNVDSELSKNGADDVRVEDIRLGSFLRKSFNRL